jgi:hypothetical protein
VLEYVLLSLEASRVQLRFAVMALELFERTCSILIPLVGGFLQPLLGLRLVLRHTTAIPVRHAGVVLRQCTALIGGLPVLQPNLKQNRRKNTARWNHRVAIKPPVQLNAIYSTGWRFYPGGFTTKPTNCFIPAVLF